MPDLDDLNELGVDLERGITLPSFASILARYEARRRRSRRRRTIAVAAGATFVVAGAAAAVVPITHGSAGKPGTLTTVSSPRPPQVHPTPVDTKGITWLRVVIDQAGAGFAVGEDCGSGRTFCRYVVKHTADNARSWQPVPSPTDGLAINPARGLSDVAAATDGNRLWFQGFPALMTGTTSGQWKTLSAPVADFDQNDYVGAGVIVERSFRTGSSPCGPGVSLMTATGFRPLAHQPRQPYQTDVTRVAPGGSLWEISPAAPTGCVLKLGLQVHGKVTSRASGPTASWTRLRAAPDMTTTSFRALGPLTAVGLLTSRHVASYDASIELKLVSTADGGSTWQTRDLHQVSIYARENDGGVLNAFDAEHLLITTDAGLEMSADGGQSFSSVLVPGVGDQVAGVSVFGTASAVVVTTGGVVMGTVDQGAHWTRRATL